MKNRKNDEKIGQNTKSDFWGGGRVSTSHPKIECSTQLFLCFFPEKTRAPPLKISELLMKKKCSCKFSCVGFCVTFCKKNDSGILADFFLKRENRENRDIFTCRNFEKNEKKGGFIRLIFANK